MNLANSPIKQEMDPPLELQKVNVDSETFIIAWEDCRTSDLQNWKHNKFVQAPTYVIISNGNNRKPPQSILYNKFCENFAHPLHFLELPEFSIS